MSTPSIRRVSYSEILSAPNAQRLIAEYAAECSIPDAEPQVAMYAAMEQAGALACFGAYADEELVGFISIVTSPMPHNGKRVATVESFFVRSLLRGCGAGNFLLDAAEEYATESGCLGILNTARIGSRLDNVLRRRAGYEATHTVHTRWL